MYFLSSFGSTSKSTDILNASKLFRYASKLILNASKLILNMSFCVVIHYSVQLAILCLSLIIHVIIHSLSC